VSLLRIPCPGGAPGCAENALPEIRDVREDPPVRLCAKDRSRYPHPACRGPEDHSRSGTHGDVRIVSGRVARGISCGAPRAGCAGMATVQTSTRDASPTPPDLAGNAISPAWSLDTCACDPGTAYDAACAPAGTPADRSAVDPSGEHMSAGMHPSTTTRLTPSAPDLAHGVPCISRDPPACAWPHADRPACRAHDTGSGLRAAPPVIPARTLATPRTATSRSEPPHRHLWARLGTTGRTTDTETSPRKATAGRHAPSHPFSSPQRCPAFLTEMNPPPQGERERRNVVRQGGLRCTYTPLTLDPNLPLPYLFPCQRRYAPTTGKLFPKRVVTYSEMRTNANHSLSNARISGMWFLAARYSSF